MGWFGHVDGTTEHVRIKPVRWGEGEKKYSLNPCQKCGSSRVDLWYVGAAEGGWGVICSDCGHLSDRLYKEEIDAVNQWNGVK